jgi:hypothetical protein
MLRNCPLAASRFSKPACSPDVALPVCMEGSWRYFPAKFCQRPSVSPENAFFGLLRPPGHVLLTASSLLLALTLSPLSPISSCCGTSYHVCLRFFSRTCPLPEYLKGTQDFLKPQRTATTDSLPHLVPGSKCLLRHYFLPLSLPRLHTKACITSHYTLFTFLRLSLFLSFFIYLIWNNFISRL